MGKYKDMVYKLPEEREVMEHLTNITDEFVESVRVTHPQKYASFIEEVRSISSKHHFNKDTLEEAKRHVGNYFSLDVTSKFAKEEYEVDFSKENFNEYDLNFMMNEMYKTYNNVYQNDTHKYAELTLAWLDRYNGKAVKYYNKMYLE